MSTRAADPVRSQPASDDEALVRFRSLYPFGLDRFQEQACRGILAGRGVLVAAPTGSGKTVVGEFAVHLAVERGTKCFYTTPIKALSNQKYNDLVLRYGPEQVGLLTGDNSINGEAAVVVMTTEVLRNMLYAGSHTLGGLAFVVMDEVHYLADRERGPVWEEVIINLPEHVGVVALSATVSNAEEFGAWLAEVRGGTDVVVEEHRPVPLSQHVLAETALHDLFVDERSRAVNPELLRLARSEQRIDKARRDYRDGGGRAGGPNRPAPGRPRKGGRRPRPMPGAARPDIVRALQREQLLPCISFIFSRAGCEAAVEQCLHAGLSLTTPQERAEIRERALARVVDLPPADLAVLGFDGWLDALERGIAAHHAGLIPTFKETVEELFQRGLVKVVYATETLALGINMPAKAVVLERLVKWNGETHAPITAGEYTQLTGRAGRRGIDVEGHAVVVWHPGIDPSALAGLASTRTYPLVSSFRPSYNMAVNLVGQLGRAAAREVLETSFAQFQADRGLVGLARQVQRNEEAIAGYEASMQCHLGDFGAYAAIRRELSEREKGLARAGSAVRRNEAVEALEDLVPGDVILVPAGRRSGPAVVLDPGLTLGEDPRPFVLTIDRQVRRLSVVDFPTPPQVLTRIRIPRSFAPRSANARRELAATLRSRLEGVEVPKPTRRRGHHDEDAELAALRHRLRAHPCHGCDEREQHARWAERAARLRAENAGVQRRLESRTNSIARQFDRICAVLAELGYLSDAGEAAAVTPAGRQLSRIYGESDLLAMECLRTGLWAPMGPAELAAACSALVYESRGADVAGAPPPRVPGAIRQALDETMRSWARLEVVEKRHGLPGTRAPDLGFAWAVHRWAGGATLRTVLEGSELTAGDFVRWCKQVMDFLGQLASATGDQQLAQTARAAIDAMRRGVVAVTIDED
ncbi:MAG: DEAD/DEAH box helicase [Candidatus Nanopelagicales bacterium]|jgi:ATP-dependent RNA helicase HelY|nr:DEAD/DEAH box helicase [Candidatus Nanopelagicales bacterium]